MVQRVILTAMLAILGWMAQAPDVLAQSRRTLPKTTLVNGPGVPLPPSPAPAKAVTELPPPQPEAGVSLAGESEAVNLTAQGAELPALLQLIAEYHRLNLVLGPDVQGKVTVSLQSAKLEEVLDAILTVNGLAWHRQGNVLFVTSVKSADGVDPRIQGRQVRVFPLNFVSATDIERVVTGLLSTAGQAFVTESSPTDQRRTQETLVVEDLPGHIRRIEEYLAQVDQPPRQVLIESHVLQVALTDSIKHGVNLTALAHASGAEISFKSTGFADSTGPGLALGIDGTDLDSLIQLIQQMGTARTLASPKVLVVNRQEAKIQIGSQLGYFVTTTTQTATLQNVQFLDLGVVLTVTPVISDDGRILMQVKPKVSGGRINPASGLPEEETTEVNTTVLLPDGGGIVIGGLIKDNSNDQKSGIPGLNRIPVVKHLFERHVVENRRDEIIIALVAHIVDGACNVRMHEQQELQQTLPPYAR